VLTLISLKLCRKTAARVVVVSRRVVESLYLCCVLSASLLEIFCGSGGGVRFRWFGLGRPAKFGSMGSELLMGCSSTGASESI